MAPGVQELLGFGIQDWGLGIQELLGVGVQESEVGSRDTAFGIQVAQGRRAARHR